MAKEQGTGMDGSREMSDNSDRATAIAVNQHHTGLVAQRRRVLRVVAVLGLLVSLVPLAACNNFFQCDKASCTSSGTSGSGSSTSDLAYVAYTSTTGTSYLVGYDISSGALTSVANITLSYIPVAVAVSPNNAFLYVASAPGSSNPGIFAYAIGSTGALTAVSSGNALVTDTIGAMTISPDGNYLFTLSSLGSAMTEYTANTSTGLLTAAGALTVPSLTCALAATTPVTQTCSVAVSPEKDFVVASFGTQGDVVYTYGSSTGIPNGTTATGISAGSESGDFSVAIDSSDNAYVAQTSSVTVYGLSSSTITNRGTVSYASGSIPRSIIVDPDSKFVYTANLGTGTISGFTIGTTTALTAISGSPFTGPAHVSAIGVDNTDAYLVAAGYDASAGLQLFSVASTGVPSLLKSAGTTTATQYPVLLAMTH